MSKLINKVAIKISENSKNVKELSSLIETLKIANYMAEHVVEELCDKLNVVRDGEIGGWQLEFFSNDVYINLEPHKLHVGYFRIHITYEDVIKTTTKKGILESVLYFVKQMDYFH